MEEEVKMHMSELRQMPLTIESLANKGDIINQLINDYSDDILHFVYTYVKNHTVAEDLTQEVLIKCYEKLHTFKQQSSIKTWAFRIASNHCKDYLRSWYYRKITLNEKILDFIPSKEKQVEDAVIQKDEETSLVNAVMTLPIKFREVIFLHYFEELTLSEISNVTGVNVNTLKTRLKRAKELVKSKIEEEV